jgi:predicted transcriptional regulator
MTRLLEMAIEAARQLSPQEQDELARTIMEIVQGGEEDIHVLSDEERAAIEEGLAEADRGEFVTEEDLRAIVAKHVA